MLTLNACMVGNFTDLVGACKNNDSSEAVTSMTKDHTYIINSLVKTKQLIMPYCT